MLKGMNPSLKTPFFVLVVALLFSGFALAASTPGLPPSTETETSDPIEPTPDTAGTGLTASSPTGDTLRTGPRSVVRTDVVPIKVTFKATSASDEYSILKIIVLQKEQNAWKRATPRTQELDGQEKGLLLRKDNEPVWKSSNTKFSRFFSALPVANSVDGSGVVLIQYETQGRKQWKIANAIPGQTLEFPGQFREPTPETEKAYPVFRIPTEVLTPGVKETAYSRFPAIGWAFTYGDGAVIRTDNKPIGYTPTAFATVAQAIGKPDQPPKDPISTEAMPKGIGGHVPIMEAGRTIQNNVFYQAKVEDAYFPRQEQWEIHWTGRGSPIVPNGDYQIILHIQGSEKKGVESVRGKDNVFSSMPVHVAGKAAQVGQYLIKEGQTFTFQDYEITMTQSSGSPEVLVKQIPTKSKQSGANSGTPILFGLKLGDSYSAPKNPNYVGATILRTDTMYPNGALAQDKSIKLRFMLSPFDVDSIKDKINDESVRKQLEKERDKFKVPTVAQTEALGERETQVRLPQAPKETPRQPLQPLVVSSPKKGILKVDVNLGRYEQVGFVVKYVKRNDVYKRENDLTRKIPQFSAGSSGKIEQSISSSGSSFDWDVESAGGTTGDYYVYLYREGQSTPIVKSAFVQILPDAILKKIQDLNKRLEELNGQSIDPRIRSDIQAKYRSSLNSLKARIDSKSTQIKKEMEKPYEPQDTTQFHLNQYITDFEKLLENDYRNVINAMYREAGQTAIPAAAEEKTLPRTFKGPECSGNIDVLKATNYISTTGPKLYALDFEYQKGRCVITSQCGEGFRRIVLPIKSTPLSRYYNSEAAKLSQEYAVSCSEGGKVCCYSNEQESGKYITPTAAQAEAQCNKAAGSDGKSTQDACKAPCAWTASIDSSDKQKCVPSARAISKVKQVESAYLSTDPTRVERALVILTQICDARKELRSSDCTVSRTTDRVLETNLAADFIPACDFVPAKGTCGLKTQP